MDTRSRAAPVPRSYQDFEPSSEWIRDDKSETLLIKLPGFKKEQVKVQIDSYRNLRTSGERPIDVTNNQWIRFRKDTRIPESLNLTGIRAKFENGALHVVIPKPFITQPAQAQETPLIQAEPKPTPQQNGKETSQPAETLQEEKMDRQPSKEVVDNAAGKVADQGGDKFFDARKEPVKRERQVSSGNGDAEKVSSGNGDAEKEPVKEERHVSSGNGYTELVREERQVSSGNGGAITGSKWRRGKAWSGAEKTRQMLKNAAVRQLMLNAAVAILLLVVLGLYVSFKVKRDIDAEGY